MDKPEKKIKQFSGPAVIEKVSGKYAILARDLTYWDRLGREHTAHKGFKTNGMSGGRIALALIGCSPFGDGLRAFILHDLYWTHADDLPDRKDRLKLRKASDKLLLEMLAVLGFCKIRRRIIYRAVRIASRFYK